MDPFSSPWAWLQARCCWSSGFSEQHNVELPAESSESLSSESSSSESLSFERHETLSFGRHVEPWTTRGVEQRVVELRAENRTPNEETPPDDQEQRPDNLNEETPPDDQEQRPGNLNEETSPDDQEQRPDNLNEETPPDDQEKVCSICLSTIDNREEEVSLIDTGRVLGANDTRVSQRRVPVCQHTFHRGCIRDWMTHQRRDGRNLRSRCPLCRTQHDNFELTYFLQPQPSDGNLLMDAEVQRKMTILEQIVPRLQFQFQGSAGWKVYAPEAQTDLGEQFRLSMEHQIRTGRALPDLALAPETSTSGPGGVYKAQWVHEANGGSTDGLALAQKKVNRLGEEMGCRRHIRMVLVGEEPPSVSQLQDMEAMLGLRLVQYQINALEAPNLRTEGMSGAVVDFVIGSESLVSDTSDQLVSRIFRDQWKAKGNEFSTNARQVHYRMTWRSIDAFETRDPFDRSRWWINREAERADVETSMYLRQHRARGE